MKKFAQNAGLILLLIVLIIVLCVAIIKAKPVQTENNTQMFTKAVCDKNKICRDFEILCENKEIKKISYTGFSVQNSENWIDSRIQKEINEECRE